MRVQSFWLRWSLGSLLLSLAAPSLAAEVAVYGKVVTTVSQYSAKEADVSEVYLNAYGSRFGIKATEKVNDCISGVAKLEYEISTAEKGSSVLKKRNNYVGLECAHLGSLHLGYKDTPYKKASSKYDIFADTFADHNNIISKSYFDRRGDHAVSYVSPKIAGAQINLMYADQPQTGIDGSENFSSGSLSYNHKLFHVVVAHEILARKDYTDETGAAMSADNVSATKVVLGGSFGQSKVNVIYETVDEDADNDTADDRNAFLVNFQQSFGKWDAKLQYGVAEDSAVKDSKDGASMWAVGAQHNLTENLAYFIQVAQLSNNKQGTWAFTKTDTNGFDSKIAEEQYTISGFGLRLSF